MDANQVKDQKFQEIMVKYSQLCAQLGELEYHYEAVIPRRRRELVKEMNELQKQANKCKPQTENGVVPSENGKLNDVSTESART